MRKRRWSVKCVLISDNLGDLVVRGSADYSSCQRTGASPSNYYKSWRVDEYSGSAQILDNTRDLVMIIAVRAHILLVVGSTSLRLRLTGVCLYVGEFPHSYSSTFELRLNYIGCVENMKIFKLLISCTDLRLHGLVRLHPIITEMHRRPVRNKF